MYFLIIWLVQNHLHDPVVCCIFVSVLWSVTSGNNRKLSRYINILTAKAYYDRQISTC